MLALTSSSKLPSFSLNFSLVLLLQIDIVDVSSMEHGFQPYTFQRIFLFSLPKREIREDRTPWCYVLIIFPVLDPRGEALPDAHQTWNCAEFYGNHRYPEWTGLLKVKEVNKNKYREII